MGALVGAIAATVFAVAHGVEHGFDANGFFAKWARNRVRAKLADRFFGEIPLAIPTVKVIYKRASRVEAGRRTERARALPRPD